MNHDWYICKYFQVLDRPASDPEWFKARNQMGQVAIRTLSSLNSPLLAVAKTNIPGGFGAVELPAGALPVPHPGRARWKERLGCTGGSNQPLTDQWPFYPQATNGRATNGNGAPSEEIQGKSWYYGPIRSRMDGATLSVFHLFDNFFLQPGGVRCNYGPEGSGWRLPSEHKQIHLFLQIV